MDGGGFRLVFTLLPGLAVCQCICAVFDDRKSNTVR